jgi:hypothetical protein
MEITFDIRRQLGLSEGVGQDDSVEIRTGSADDARQCGGRSRAAHRVVPRRAAPGQADNPTSTEVNRPLTLAD